MVRIQPSVSAVCGLGDEHVSLARQRLGFGGVALLLVNPGQVVQRDGIMRLLFEQQFQVLCSVRILADGDADFRHLFGRRHVVRVLGNPVEQQLVGVIGPPGPQQRTGEAGHQKARRCGIVGFGIGGHGVRRAVGGQVDIALQGLDGAEFAILRLQPVRRGQGGVHAGGFQIDHDIVLIELIVAWARRDPGGDDVAGAFEVAGLDQQGDKLAPRADHIRRRP